MRKFWFISLCGLSAAMMVLAQDSLQRTIPQPTSQASSDSTVAIQPAATKPAAPVSIDSDTVMLSPKDWIALASILVALVALVFGGYFARKKKEAELRAEYEMKERMKLEERQRKVEEELARLTAGRQFEQQHQQQERVQQAKTAEERYRYMLENEVCQIHLAAPGIEGVPVSLIDTFVRLNISEHYRGEDFPHWGEAGRGQREHEDLSPEEVMQRAFQEYNRKLLLIIGDPGSGKTTLLKYYATCCMQPEGHSKLGFSAPIFPMYLPLREVDPNLRLAENLSRWAQKHDPQTSAQEFHTWLDERDTLVLLDGLDEVSQLADRKKVCAWIDNKCAGIRRAKFVFTSRGTGMRSSDNLFLNTKHLHAEVRDFSHEQKQEFLRKWFKAAHLEGSRPRKGELEADWRERQIREAEKNAADVIAYLDQRENRSLRELAGIPMLLQLLALIWKHHGTKPKSRTKLYDVALDYLLEYRDDQRGMKPVLLADNARRVLCPAALWMHEELGAEEVAKEKMHEFIKPILEPIDHTVKPDKLCENLRDRAGLIADYGKNEYIFRHKSFREYFAGLQLAAGYNENNRVALLVKTFGDTAWAEPLRYFMSKADGKAFTAFMQAFFNSPKSRELSQEQQDLLQTLVREAPEKLLDAFVACLNDPSKNEKQQRYALDCLKNIGGERVKGILQAFARSEVTVVSVRDYAFEIAAQLEKPAFKPAARTTALFEQLPSSFRNSVEYNAEYILIRGGTIQYSVNKTVETIPDIYFAKYPVTNKQYRRFIRYLREEEPELVKVVGPKNFAEKLLEYSASVQGYTDYLGRETKAWSDKLKSTYDDDRKFNGEDQPVVGVSWYASRAYCFWLSALEAANDETLRGASTSAQKLTQIFRLPQEIEWERAAAGRREDGEPRMYPWPNEKGKPNEKLANYGGKVGQTTPVGRYPEGATPDGLMDVAGNVWEWQENWEDEKEKKYRALRGGSWVSSSDDLPCAFRFSFDPDSRFNYVGFRVVRAQSVFDTL